MGRGEWSEAAIPLGEKGNQQVMVGEGLEGNKRARNKGMVDQTVCDCLERGVFYVIVPHNFFPILSSEESTITQIKRHLGAVSFSL
ncbi:hypothetical protein SLA2020_260820 [Shorea laevis]